MADPFLEEGRKSRAMKQFSAVLELSVAGVRSDQGHEKLSAAWKRAAELDATTKPGYLKGTVVGLVQEQLAMEREKSRLGWQTYKLYLFAPWEEATLSERVVNLSLLVSANGFRLPLVRLILWLRYRSCVNS